MYCIDLTKKTIDKVEYGGSYPKPVAFHSAVEVNEKCFMVFGINTAASDCKHGKYLLFYKVYM